MMVFSSNKRQRTAEQSLRISNLPDGILSHVASYLAKPSRALFALAMTSTSESWTKDFSTDIRSEQQQTIASILQSEDWKELDFEDIEKTLAHKLSDDDLHAVLKCISTQPQDVLKKLKLTGCVSIIGHGLRVLSGSTIIEHIDLSLAKQFESPELNPEPMILEADVIPILESIISTNGNSLKMIVFPKKWRETKTTQLTRFLTKYNQLLKSREPKCSECNRLVEGRYDMVCHGEENDWNWQHYGTQSYCCHKCMDHFCYNCGDDGDGPLKCCGRCEKEYCTGCEVFKHCGDCDNMFCDGCKSMKTCDGCEADVCLECAPKPSDLCACHVGKTYCGNCMPDIRPCNMSGCDKKMHCIYCAHVMGVRRASIPILGVSYQA